MVSKSKMTTYLKSLITDTTTKAEIDIITDIRKCVEQFTDKEQNEPPKVDFGHYFDTLWKLYPRKVNKELAKRTFEHKFRGLTEDECREKANKVYVAEKRYIAQLEEQGTETQFILHFSSWLNANVPNSTHYKGVR